MDSSSEVCAPRDCEIRIAKWKVREGYKVSHGAVLCIYDTDNAKGLKIKATEVGTVVDILAKAGELLEPGCPLLRLQSCTHATVMKDMCADCGADLREEAGLSGDRRAPVSASVAMIHSIPELIVSEEQAMELGKADEDRLLKTKKLVLLVDLDQTLIHTTNDNIPANLKGVHHFQLPHGNSKMWYHTRMRPKTTQFLEAICKMYELHICTFGVRMYAHTIARLLDPEGIFFSHRIMSRDECLNQNSKTANLKALFPCGDYMVCIIDDREDVWNFSPNLVHVKPYRFFQGTADINAPLGLAKTENDKEPLIHKVRKISRSESREEKKTDTSKDGGGDGASSWEKESDKGTENKIASEKSQGKTEDKTSEEKSTIEGESHVVPMETESKYDTTDVDKDALASEKTSADKQSDDVVSTESSKTETDGNADDKNDADKNDDENKDEATKDGGKEETKTDGDVDEKKDGEKNDEVTKDGGKEETKTDGDIDEKKDEEKNDEVTKDGGKEETKTDGDIDEKKDEEKNDEVTKDGGKEETKNDGDVDEKKDGEKNDDVTKDGGKKETKTDGDVDEKKDGEKNDDVTKDGGKKETKTDGDVDEKKDGEKNDEVTKDGGKKETKTDGDVDEKKDGEKNDDVTKDGGKEEEAEEIEWDDDDDYLLYLEDILTRIHKAFYDLHDQLQNKTAKDKTESPDLKNIIPYVKRKVLKGLNILFSGVFPTNIPPEKSRAYIVAKDLGANIQTTFIPNVGSNPDATTHLVAALLGTSKVRIVQKAKGVAIVNPNWLWSCAERYERVSELLFPLQASGPSATRDSPEVFTHMSKKQKRKAEESEDFSDEEKMKPAEKKSKTSEPVKSREERFSASYNPLYAFSDDDIAYMDKEVEEIMDETDDDQSDEDEDERNARFRSKVLSSDSVNDSSSDDSLSGEFPRGWKVKSQKSTSNENSPAHEKDPVDMYMAGGEESENELDKFEKTVEAFAKDSSTSESDYGESIGSVDDEMAAAVEREFLSK